MLLSQSALKIWNIYFIFIRMSDVGMFFCQRFFFPYERLSLPVSNNVDKYLKLSQIFGIGQFFFPSFFVTFECSLIKTDSTDETMMGCGMKEQAKVHIISSLLLYLLSLSLFLSSTSTLCPLFPASLPPFQANVWFFFMAWVSVFIMDEGCQAANVLLWPQLPLPTGRLKLQRTSKISGSNV